MWFTSREQNLFRWPALSYFSSGPTTIFPTTCLLVSDINKKQFGERSAFRCPSLLTTHGSPCALMLLMSDSLGQQPCDAVHPPATRPQNAECLWGSLKCLELPVAIGRASPTERTVSAIRESDNAASDSPCLPRKSNCRTVGAWTGRLQNKVLLGQWRRSSPLPVV